MFVQSPIFLPFFCFLLVFILSSSPSHAAFPSCPYQKHHSASPERHCSFSLMKDTDIDTEKQHLERRGVENKEKDDSLLNANKFFRYIYNDTRTQLVKARQDKLLFLFMEGDHRLITWYHGERFDSGSLTPTVYTDYKSISHIALNTFTILQPVVDLFNGTLNHNVKDHIDTYIPLLLNARTAIPSRFQNQSVIDREIFILDSSLSFLKAVRSTGKVALAELNAFTRRLTPHIYENIYGAVYALLEALHKEVMKWQLKATREEWDQLLVIISSSHMPRKDNDALQYFSRLLNTPQMAERRVIYAESLWDEQAALSLLGTHLNDWGNSQAFFDDIDRMHSDVLDNTTRAILPHFLPSSPCCRPDEVPEEHIDGGIRSTAVKVEITVVVLLGLSAVMIFVIKALRKRQSQREEILVEQHPPLTGAGREEAEEEKH